MKGLLYTFFYSAGLLAAYAFSPFSQKLRKGLRGRKHLLRRMRQHCGGWENPLWFHVASSGELEQCLPILDAVKRKSPQQKIFLSVFSPSGLEGLAKEEQRRLAASQPRPWDYADYCPFDLAFFIHPFLNALKPEKLICIQREIWPNLITSCHNRGIACLLFGSYFSTRARRIFGLYRPWIDKFDFIGTVDDDTTAYLVLALHADHIQTIGDPRIERVESRRLLNKSPVWLDFFAEKPVFLAGSIWKEDEDALKESLDFLQGRGWRLVLVPHEVSGAKAFQQRLQKNGIASRLWSHWMLSPDNDSHLIVDEIGILAELYRVSTISFVGGSFRKRVHNVLEPAAYRVPVLTGPFIDNSAEAKKMRSLGALKSPADGIALRETLRELVESPEALESQKAALEKFFALPEPIAEKYALLSLA
ncbi:MAG: glycosyltransferase N-terminal domain-containing protein [Bdellovibrionota bacterium]